MKPRGSSRATSARKGTSAPGLHPFLIFISFYALYVALTWRDYPVNWDTAHVVELGTRTFDFYFKGDRSGPAVQGGFFIDHNFIYSAFLVALTGGKQVPYEVLHLLSMVCASLLYGGAYWVFRRETGHPYWALAGPIALFTTPLFMGHIPGNFMDGGNALGFLAALFAVYLTASMPKTSWRRILILGLFFGAASTLRLSGLTLFPILLVFDLLTKERSKKGGWGPWLWKEALSLTGILLTAHCVMVLSWPYLLHDYPARLGEIFHAGTNLVWSAGTFYLGRNIPSQELPWHYLPVWTAVTTPLFLFAFALLGSSPSFRRKRDPWLTLAYCALAVNWAVFLIVKPVIHSGIRHLLYLLPVVSLAGARVGVDFIRRTLALERRPLASTLALGAAFLSFLLTLTTMVRLHPQQYLYYSELAGGFPNGYRFFEKDYWVSGNKEALEWAARHSRERFKDRRAKVRTYGAALLGDNYMAPWMERCDCVEGGWDYRVFSRQEGPLPEELRGKVLHTVERMGAPLGWVLFEPSPQAGK